TGYRDYIQAWFDDFVTLYVLSIQAGSSRFDTCSACVAYMHHVQLTYSSDNLAYSAYPHYIPGSYNKGDMVSSYRLVPEIHALTFRIYAYDYSSRAEIRWMLYGCKRSKYNVQFQQPVIISNYQTVRSSGVTSYSERGVIDQNRSPSFGSGCWRHYYANAYITIDLVYPRYIDKVYVWAQTNDDSGVVTSEVNKFSKLYVSNSSYAGGSGIVVDKIGDAVVPQPWLVKVTRPARFVGVGSYSGSTVYYTICEIEVYGYPLGSPGDQLSELVTVRTGLGSRYPATAARASRVYPYNGLTGDVYSLPLEFVSDEAFNFALYLYGNGYFDVYLPCVYTVTGFIIQGSSMTYPYYGRFVSLRILYAYEKRHDMLTYYRDLETNGA
uniref:CUB domain-containing protein n=1 Tax=Macrostomum lignano TaxID=282301 RepID=A0A1I8JAQ7_9PLAT